MHSSIWQYNYFPITAWPTWHTFSARTSLNPTTELPWSNCKKFAMSFSNPSNSAPVLNPISASFPAASHRTSNQHWKSSFRSRALKLSLSLNQPSLKSSIAYRVTGNDKSYKKSKRNHKRKTEQKLEEIWKGMLKMNLEKAEVLKGNIKIVAEMMDKKECSKCATVVWWQKNKYFVTEIVPLSNTCMQSKSAKAKKVIYIRAKTIKDIFKQSKSVSDDRYFPCSTLSQSITIIKCHTGHTSHINITTACPASNQVLFQLTTHHLKVIILSAVDIIRKSGNHITQPFH